MFFPPGYSRTCLFLIFTVVLTTGHCLHCLSFAPEAAPALHSAILSLETTTAAQTVSASHAGISSRTVGTFESGNSLKSDGEAVENKEISLEVPGFGPVSFVLIRSGSFMMGSSNQRVEGEEGGDAEESAASGDEEGLEAAAVVLPEGSGDPDSEEDEIWRKVTLSRDYYIGKTEVVQGLYKFIVSENPSCFRWSGDDFPVEQVSWFDAIWFCNALSRRMGLEECYNEKIGDCDFSKRGFRLPTEAEWEMAARAGTLTVFDFGDDNVLIKDYAVVSSTGAKSTARVGTFKSTASGLNDIYGNVWEWCQDLYLFECHTLPAVDPCWQGVRPVAGGGDLGESAKTPNVAGDVTAEDPDIEEEEEARMRVIRGGGWGSVYYDCRPANRGRGVPTGNFNDVGFRIVLPR